MSAAAASSSTVNGSTPTPGQLPAESATAAVSSEIQQVKEKIAKLEEDIKRLSSDIEQAKKERDIDMVKLLLADKTALLADKTALQEKENLLLKQLQEARTSAATTSDGWIRDLTAEGVESNPGPPLCQHAGCDCALSRNELTASKETGGESLGLRDLCPGCDHKVAAHSTSNTASSSSTVQHFTSEQLLLQARPRLLPAQASDWVIRLTRLYPNEMNLATRDQSLAHMRAICDRFEQQPRSTTIRIFHEQGISLGDPLHTTGNAVLYYGTKGSTPVILKKLDDSFELKGYQAVDALDPTQRRSNHLAPFNLFKAVSPLSTPAPPSPGDRQPASSSSSSPPSSSSSAALILSSASSGDIPPPGASLPRTPTKSTKSGVSVSSSSSGVGGAQLGASFPSSTSTHSRVSRDWVSMHHYPTTLDGFARPMSAEAASKLLTQMLSALHFLHMSGLAHMDVKPSNILVDSFGEFWLGDFGSVRRIGTTSINTTPSFLPREMRQPLIEPYLVSQQHDDWMLGMTVADMLAARPEDGVGTGATDPSSDYVLRVLADLNTPEATQLMNRLRRNCSTG